MRYSRRHFNGVQFAAFVLFAFACCSGCSLGDALLDGVFLGMSETVGTLFSAVFVS